MLRHEVCLCASHQYVSLRWEVAAFTRKAGQSRASVRTCPKMCSEAPALFISLGMGTGLGWGSGSARLLSSQEEQ